MKLPTRVCIVALLGDITIALTMIAGIPFELGEAANYLDPHLKMELVKYGALASVALKLVQRLTEHVQGTKDAEGIKTAKDAIKSSPDIG